MNRTTALFALALVLSLGLNTLQWLTAPSGAAVEAGQQRAAQDGSETVADPGSQEQAGAAEDPRETTCWVELADCRADGLDASREAARAFTHHDPLGEEEQGHVGAAGLVLPGSHEVDADFQDDVLETIALGQLRDAWEEQEEETIASILETVSDEEQGAATRERDLARAYTLLQVPDEQREAFEAGWGNVWQTHVDEVRQALEQSPADAGGALVAVKALFRDQDSYVAEHLGDDARRHLRLAQAEHRTTVLALMATFAGEPWDERITW
ncbi:MAG: hypothetical protein JRH11_27780 [Deltaproteobacteria bacterium]|nr:hypothetical protein [Deltaproteobacteria bacterium]